MNLLRIFITILIFTTTIISFEKDYDDTYLITFYMNDTTGLNIPAIIRNVKTILSKGYDIDSPIIEVQTKILFSEHIDTIIYQYKKDNLDFTENVTFDMVKDDIIAQLKQNYSIYELEKKYNKSFRNYTSIASFLWNYYTKLTINNLKKYNLKFDMLSNLNYLTFWNYLINKHNESDLFVHDGIVLNDIVFDKVFLNKLELENSHNPKFLSIFDLLIFMKNNKFNVIRTYKDFNLILNKTLSIAIVKKYLQNHYHISKFTKHNENCVLHKINPADIYYSLMDIYNSNSLCKYCQDNIDFLHYYSSAEKNYTHNHYKKSIKNYENAFIRLENTTIYNAVQKKLLNKKILYNLFISLIKKYRWVEATKYLTILVKNDISYINIIRDDTSLKDYLKSSIFLNSLPGQIKQIQISLPDKKDIVLSKKDIIYIAGDFNNWDYNKDKMIYDNKTKEFYFTTYLLPGKYKYKFYYNNKWIEYTKSKPFFVIEVK